MAAPSDESVDFTSPKFDPVTALYSENTTVPYPNINPFNNFDQYTAYLKRAAVRMGKQTPTLSAHGSPALAMGGTIITNTDSSTTDREKLALKNLEDSRKPLTPDELASLASKIDISDSPALTHTHGESSQREQHGNVAVARHITKTSVDESSVQDAESSDSSRTLVYVKQKKRRNVLGRMEEYSGPLSILYRSVSEKLPVKVWTRSYNHVRGFCRGYIVAFDKHWNLAMADVDETYRKPQEPPRRQKRGGKKHRKGNQLSYDHAERKLESSEDEVVVVDKDAKIEVETEKGELAEEEKENNDKTEGVVEQGEQAVAEEKEDDEEDLDDLKKQLENLKELLLELEESSDSNESDTSENRESELTEDEQSLPLCSPKRDDNGKAKEHKYLEDNSDIDKRKSTSNTKGNRKDFKKGYEKGSSSSLGMLQSHEAIHGKNKKDASYNREKSKREYKEKDPKTGKPCVKDSDRLNRHSALQERNRSSRRSSPSSHSDNSSRSRSDSHHRSSSRNVRSSSSYKKDDLKEELKTTDRHYKKNRHEKSESGRGYKTREMKDEEMRHTRLHEKKDRNRPKSYQSSRPSGSYRTGGLDRSPGSGRGEVDSKSRDSKIQTKVRPDDLKLTEKSSEKKDNTYKSGQQCKQSKSSRQEPVICQRHVNQLFIRGDNIVMVAIVE